MARGDLPSDELVMGALRNYIKTHNSKDGFIFDGVPRTMNQVRILDEILTGLNMKIDHIIYFDVSTEQLIKRLLGRIICADCAATYNVHFKPPQQDGVCDVCGGTNLNKRSDDNENSIRTRLQVYLDKTQDVIEHYQKLRHV